MILPYPEPKSHEDLIFLFIINFFIFFKKKYEQGIESDRKLLFKYLNLLKELLYLV
jgi:hypothetical protein